MNQKIRKVTELGILTALVVVLQLVAQFIHIPFLPFAFNLVNVPIVIGAILYGVPGGLWLGFVFGMVVLLSGDAAPFLAISIPGTVITVLIKGVASGAGAGVSYKLFCNRNRTAATVVSAILCPVINTGLFLLGCLIFFMDTLRGWAAGAGSESVAFYMIFVLVGGNFLVELVLSVLLSPAVIRVIGLVKKNR